MTGFMTVEEALETVLELAVENMISEWEEDEALVAERERQQCAIDVMVDFCTNVVVEGRIAERPVCNE
jgi:hypothetical protein